MARTPFPHPKAEELLEDIERQLQGARRTLSELLSIEPATASLVPLGPQLRLIELSVQGFRVQLVRPEAVRHRQTELPLAQSSKEGPSHD